MSGRTGVGAARVRLPLRRAPWGGHGISREAAGWPPPAYPDRSLRNVFMRRVPLRLRAVVRTFWYRGYGEMLSYLRQW